MSTRRRVGFSTSTSEASRRQLMQPVPCWEKVWVIPDGAPLGSTFKVYKWVKTDKRQQFSDDEGETDQPLAPLPDEPEAVEGDDEMDQDEITNSVAPTPAPISREVSEALPLREESKPATPKPHPLSVSFQPASPPAAEDDGLDESLKPTEGNLGAVVDDIELDMAQMGPDGEPFEDVGDLSQLQATDTLLGGPNLLGDVMEEDPFVVSES
ncbi:hypothetical protein BDY19DRAFT_902129 [Irpex rosettiformis]|uniref:Uncharacterized protein n=1 Tax=Irpex rosettiformis TaxID=378272 RepID=A0ACB8UL62_9APHY|nr:hypothetical protein BDY19DRAFT_902129 [Irpex rosettiformis]